MVRNELGSHAHGSHVMRRTGSGVGMRRHRSRRSPVAAHRLLGQHIGVGDDRTVQVSRLHCCCCYCYFEGVSVVFSGKGEGSGIGILMEMKVGARRDVCGASDLLLHENVFKFFCFFLSRDVDVLIRAFLYAC